MAGKRDGWTEWSDFENDYILRNYRTMKNGKLCLIKCIAKALYRSYNETKCHIYYMEKKGLLGKETKKNSVWDAESVSKREFLKEVVKKYQFDGD